MSVPARPLLLNGALLVAVALLAVPAAVGRVGDASALPNPCKLVPVSAINKAFGLPAATHTTGTLKQGQVAICVYTHGAAKLQVEVAPKAYGSNGYGGPPGMVVSKPAGFGPGARFLTDTNPKYAFSSLSFVKGAYWGDIWANGKVPSARVLALARVLYEKL
jgi:hypothetical protein